MPGGGTAFDPGKVGPARLRNRAWRNKRALRIGPCGSSPRGRVTPLLDPLCSRRSRLLLPDPTRVSARRDVEMMRWILSCRFSGAAAAEADVAL